MPKREPAADLLLDFLRAMRRIRCFEERVAELYEEKAFGTPIHLCVGQEGVAAGVCGALRKEDYVFGAHRSHGHYLAKGGGMKEMMAEIFGKATGCSRGRGGSMHLCAPEVGFLGTVPIVSATIPLAVGAALASKLRGESRVTVSFFGDGAVEEGATHEALNLAALHKLPVIFVCENNFYSSHLGLLERRAQDNLIRTPEAHGMTGKSLDGNDVLAVHEATAEAAERARSGAGPTFFECRTYRWRGHVGPSYDLDVGVKRKDELQEWKAKDPIDRVEKLLAAKGVTRSAIERMAKEAVDEVEASVEFARRSPFPDPEELATHLFAKGGA